MTVHALAEVAIEDLDRFVSVFGSEGLEKRAEHGCVGPTGRVVVLLEFPDAEALTAFRSDPAAPPIMRKGGAQGPPVFQVLSRVETFEH